MSEKKNSKVIGARKLNMEEIRRIMPTYDRIEEQVEEIRGDYRKLKEEGKDIHQKINNIGILGHRGTGKTSVLKTIEDKLKSQITDDGKQKNIIMPMIVPENMSSSMKLMSSILGLFKTLVDERDRLDDDKECWERKSNIKKAYDELLKKYCFVQDEYRSILVQSYSTESDYINHSGQVFNADNGFLDSFNKFLKIVFDYEKYSDDAMIILFIDDIDLSTSRCVDVVKTLLAYVSHPRIITFLSGDLDTFEEALTLDFLRQEFALEGNLLKIEFVEKENLLDRKKQLAYEYLKKVMPPVYRHTVKKWTIAERGDYCITDTNQGQEKSQNSQGTLGQLLDETFGNLVYGCIGFFRYGVNLKNNDTETEIKIYNLPQVYHMFDETARGLNNVYNVLIDMKDDLQKYAKGNENEEAKVRAFAAVKLVLETVVASNSVLNEERKFLFEQIIHFGSSFETTEIRIDNLNSISIKDGENDKRDHVFESRKFFALCIFIEFAIRILGKNRENEYREFHGKIVLALINYPVISESLVDMKCDLVVNGTEKGKSELNALFFGAELAFVLQYFQFCEDKFEKLNEALIIPQNVNMSIYHARAWYVLDSMLVLVKQQKNMDEKMTKEVVNTVLKSAIDILYQNNVYSPNKDAYFYTQVLGFDQVMEKYLKESNDNIKEQLKQEGIKVDGINFSLENGYLWSNWLGKTLNRVRERGNWSEDDEKRWRIVEKISKHKQWENEEVEGICSRLMQTKERILSVSDKGSNESKDSLDVVLTDEFKSVYSKIMSENYTYTWGGYDKLKGNLKTTLEENGKIRDKISIEDYWKIVGSFEAQTRTTGQEKMTIKGFLANNNLYAGRGAVYRLYDACKELYINIELRDDETEDDEIENYDSVYVWLLCYIKYKEDTEGELREISEMIALLSAELSILNLSRKKESKESILTILSKDEDDFSVSYEDIGRLFKIKREE